MQRMEQAAGGEDLEGLLQAIEKSALRLYAQHGLPTVSGHYRSRGPDEAWVALGAQLSATERWTMIHESADGEWRYATLEAIGARSENAEVRQASAILCACSGLRQRMSSHPSIAQDLADSIRLGAAWRAFETAATPLEASFPSDAFNRVETVEAGLTHTGAAGATASSAETSKSLHSRLFSTRSD